jgi:hypothetical protein
MSDRKQAAKLFVSEIPGALPLQRHFFDKLQTAEWLPHLANQGLFGEPLATLDEGTSGGMRFRQCGPREITYCAWRNLRRSGTAGGRGIPVQGRFFQTP